MSINKKKLADLRKDCRECAGSYWCKIHAAMAKLAGIVVETDPPREDEEVKTAQQLAEQNALNLARAIFSRPSETEEDEKQSLPEHARQKIREESAHMFKEALLHEAVTCTYTQTNKEININISLSKKTLLNIIEDTK